MWRVLEQVVAIGAVLLQARVRRGLTLEEVASASRIPVHYIEALETDAFDDLPAPVYVRGFLRVYSRFLEVDSEPLLDELVSVWPAAAPSAPPTTPALPVPQDPEVWEVPESARTVAPLPHRRIISDSEDDWEPELEPVVRRRGGYPFTHLKRRGHLDGVLSEREPADPVRLPDRRWIALGGGAVILFAVLLLGAAILRGANTTNDSGTTSPVPNRTFQPGTVIAVGSPTATPPTSATPQSDASVAAPGAPAPAAGTASTPVVAATPRPTTTP